MFLNVGRGSGLGETRNGREDTEGRRKEMREWSTYLKDRAL